MIDFGSSEQMERWHAALQKLIDGEQYGYTRRRRQGVSGDIKDTVAAGRKARGGRADDDDDYEVCVCLPLCVCVRVCVCVHARARVCRSLFAPTHSLVRTVRRLDAWRGC